MPKVGVPPVALLLLAALALPANASLVEESTGHAASYQFDGDTHHDAPDACAAADPAWSAPVGAATDGILVPVDDLSDVFVLDVPPALVGGRLDVAVAEAAGTPDVTLATFLPGCLADILDPVAQPVPEPSPPAPAPGERQAVPTNLHEPWDCEDGRWIFLLSGLGGPAPRSIHVAWTDGAERTVPLGGQYHGWAWYASHDSPGILLKGAWANLPQAWGGDFALAQGDCGAVDGGAVYGDPAVRLGARLVFTPVRAGPHLVQVSFSGQPPGASTALTCHFCLPQLEQGSGRASYRLSVAALAG